MNVKHLVPLLLAAAACGTAAPAERSPAPVEDHPIVGPPSVPWDKLTHGQKAKFMEAVVVPRLKPMFQQFDAKGFADFTCTTCHGAGAKDHTFKMPNPDNYVLPEAHPDFLKLVQDKPAWMKLMGDVEKTMADTLDLPVRNPAAPDPSQFGCFGCHTHKPGGQDPSGARGER